MKRCKKECSNNCCESSLCVCQFQNQVLQCLASKLFNSFHRDHDLHASNMAKCMPLLHCLAADGPRSSDELDRVRSSAARLWVVVSPHPPHALVPGQVSGVDSLTMVGLRLA